MFTPIIINPILVNYFRKAGLIWLVHPDKPSVPINDEQFKRLFPGTTIKKKGVVEMDAACSYYSTDYLKFLAPCSGYYLKDLSDFKRKNNVYFDE